MEIPFPSPPSPAIVLIAVGGRHRRTPPRPRNRNLAVRSLCPLAKVPQHPRRAWTARHPVHRLRRPSGPETNPADPLTGGAIRQRCQSHLAQNALHRVRKQLGEPSTTSANPRPLSPNGSKPTFPKPTPSSRCPLNTDTGYAPPTPSKPSASSGSLDEPEPSASPPTQMSVLRLRHLRQNRRTLPASPIPSTCLLSATTLPKMIEFPQEMGRNLVLCSGWAAYASE